MFSLLLTAATVGVAPDTTTHKQIKEIAVKGTNGNSLQTLTIGPDGRVLGLVAGPRYGTGKGAGSSEVRVFDGDGTALKSWKVDFTAQSIAAGPDGKVYVAGSGKIARFDRDGASLGVVEMPHLTEVLKDKSKLEKQAKDQLEAEKKSFQNTVKSFADRKKAIEEKDASERTTAEKAQLKALESNIKQYEQITNEYEKRSIADVVSQLTTRLSTINAVSVTDKDAFIACGEMKGYGYAVWRMDVDLKNPKQIINGLGGCCGQMDIQAQGEFIYVAENTKHQVGKYDRTGKKLAGFGKRGREGDGECFGGCCNPMNCRISAKGDVIYTAESEGVVKSFSSAGEFLGNVGSAKLAGGCKNVALATSPDGNKVYFCDQPGSRIIILAKKDSAGSGGGR